MEVYPVSRCNLSLYSTTKICIQCLTDQIIFSVAVESIFKNPLSALLFRYFQHSLESDNPVSVLATDRVTRPPSGFCLAVLFSSARYSAENPNRYVLAGLLPGPNRNPVFFGWVGTGPRVHFAVPTFLAPIKYLSSDRIMT